MLFYAFSGAGVLWLIFFILWILAITAVLPIAAPAITAFLALWILFLILWLIGGVTFYRGRRSHRGIV